MGCLKLTYDQGERVEENASFNLWEVYKKGESASKKCIEYYRYGFQGQFAEEDSETGWNSFELRMYDAIIGRWTTTDPAGQYFSPYTAMGNNFINKVDPNGALDDFIFDQNGNYLRTENIGDPNHRIIIEGASGNQIINFNDVGFDFNVMQDMISTYGGKTPFLFTMNSQSIAGFIANSGEDPYKLFYSLPSITRLWNEGHVGGDFDFSSGQLMEFATGRGIALNDIAAERGGFYVVGNTAYNYFDFGNFLTGKAMGTHGAPLWSIRLGGHIHHLKERTLYEGAGLLDAPADQRALIDGFNYSIQWPANFFTPNR
ncbi:MAG: RHS repeat-associated core domain-containing protein [Bacteroidota bacterium]